MAFFLLVYDQAAGKLRQITEYKDAQRDEAQAARFALERTHRLDRNIEVVLLGAHDRATLEETHARYFKSVKDLLASA